MEIQQKSPNKPAYVSNVYFPTDYNKFGNHYFSNPIHYRIVYSSNHQLSTWSPSFFNPSYYHSSIYPKSRNHYQSKPTLHTRLPPIPPSTSHTQTATHIHSNSITGSPPHWNPTIHPQHSRPPQPRLPPIPHTHRARTQPPHTANINSKPRMYKTPAAASRPAVFRAVGVCPYGHPLTALTQRTWVRRLRIPRILCSLCKRVFSTTERPIVCLVCAACVDVADRFLRATPQRVAPLPPVPDAMRRGDQAGLILEQHVVASIPLPPDPTQHVGQCGVFVHLGGVCMHDVDTYSHTLPHSGADMADTAADDALRRIIPVLCACGVLCPVGVARWASRPHTVQPTHGGGGGTVGGSRAGRFSSVGMPDCDGQAPADPGAAPPPPPTVALARMFLSVSATLCDSVPDPGPLHMRPAVRGVLHAILTDTPASLTEGGGQCECEVATQLPTSISRGGGITPPLEAVAPPGPAFALCPPCWALVDGMGWGAFPALWGHIRQQLQHVALSPAVRPAATPARPVSATLTRHRRPLTPSATARPQPPAPPGSQPHTPPTPISTSHEPSEGEGGGRPLTSPPAPSPDSVQPPPTPVDKEQVIASLLELEAMLGSGTEEEEEEDDPHALDDPRTLLAQIAFLEESLARVDSEVYEEEEKEHDHRDFLNELDVLYREVFAEQPPEPSEGWGME